VDTLVTVNPQPVADFTMSESQGCAPLFVDLVNASTQADAWIWDLGNGSTLSTQAGTMPAGLFTEDYHETVDLQVATYTLTLTALDAAGCSDVHSQELVVYPKAKFDLTLPFDSACSPLSLDLAAIDGAVDGTWDFGDGTTGSGLEVSHEWTNWTGDLASHVVTFEGVNEYGCAALSIQRFT
jgi:PKD repeat protein